MSTTPHVYTHGHHESVLHAHRHRTAKNSAGYLLPHLAPGLSVLDVGCGPGTLTVDLARRVAPGRVTALERSPEILRLAREEAETGDIHTIDFVSGDIHALTIPDATFDVVHAHQVLQHLADPTAALREMRRVCRPGGIVAARDGDYATFAWYPLVPELDEWLTLYRRQARRNGGEPDAGRRLPSWARAAGFVDITATASVWCFASPEERQWWGTSWADRIVRSDLARQLVAAGQATDDDLLRISRGWQSWAEAADGWFSVTHGEILCRA